ncbi:MAG: DUF4998 domain-containing protein [Mangrovibacterium sp.]
MKINLYILLALCIGTGLHSCKNQDDIYQEFVKKGGYVYPQKTNGLAVYSGYKRIKLTWSAPKDPSVRTAKVYWNNKTEVKDIDYASYTGDRIELDIDGLEERSYTFNLVNFDSNGNQSMMTETTASPYAENWLMMHAERTVSSAQVNGTAADLVMSYGTDEMIETRFRYVSKNGETVVHTQTMDAISNKISLPDAVSGKRFEFSSSYCPAEGLDTIWNDWTRSTYPISGLLDCKSWGVDVTANQIWDGNFLPTNVLDGINDRNHRWCSAQGTQAAVFPKIMVVDTKKDSYSINKFILYQDPTSTSKRYANSVEIYWGNEPFDPNAGTDYATSPGFAKAIVNNTYLTTTFYFGTASWARSWADMQKFRYMAIVWKNSRSASGWIDLWEIEFYGYDAAAGD